MSGRPLELRIYPPAPPEPEDNISLEWFAWHGDRSREQMFCEWKRLTDAELAAEYHASMASANFALSEGLPWADEMARHNTVCRFATHPHYDEEQA